MQVRAVAPQSHYAQNAATTPRRVHSVEELRMALEDKARGQRIAALRKNKRLTQQAMADRLKIGYRTYQTWESGSVMPEWPNLEKLAKFFKVKPEDIIGEIPDPDRLLGPGNEISIQLDRLEAKLDRALGELAAIRAQEAGPSRQGAKPSPGRQPSGAAAAAKKTRRAS
jgi:transcriptional regulator with XRE-family HTH domain